LGIGETSTANSLLLGVGWAQMEVIGVTSGREPSAVRPEGSTHVFVTIDGVRDAHVRNRDTRLKITLAATQAGRLWRMLGDALGEDEKAAV
jgi:hypothetical protein